MYNKWVYIILRSIVEHKVIILRYFATFENIVRRNIH